MYLLDTNILIELLLDQEKAGDVEQLLHSVPPSRLWFSEFSLYSVGIILIRRRMYDVLARILDDLFGPGGIRVIRLEVEDMAEIASTARRFNLDFDDAYQYTVASKYGYILVSFDEDFDRTDRGRKTPAEILAP